MSFGTERSTETRPSLFFVWPLRPPLELALVVWSTFVSAIVIPFVVGSAFRPLRAVGLELAHDRGAFHGVAGARALLELQPEFVLAEELGEHLAAERAHRGQLAGLRIVLQQDRRERLRRGT